MRILFKHIDGLLQVRKPDIRLVAGADMKELPSVRGAYLVIENQRIAGFGEMSDCPEAGDFDDVIDASGRLVLPCWCDSHTHLVYAASREGEFVDRIKGLSYQQIAEKGGGILNSAQKLQTVSEEELFEQSLPRLHEVMQLGTGAIEIKSGYGLTVEGELKMLRVIKRLAEASDIPIKATFLGAHAIPKRHAGDARAYLQELIQEALPIIASERLAEYVDIFCEEGYFSVEDTDYLLEKSSEYGLTPKIHVNQFTALGGVEAGVRHNALSVDHLEVLREEDIASLRGSSTMPVALPGCSFFLSIPYTPARALMEAGLPVALATDFNPGSAPSGNMNFVVSTACIKMQMTPEEAVNAATINGAYAMGLEKEVGSITVGKRANVLLTKPVPSTAYLPYAFGANLIERVWINGKEI